MDEKEMSVASVKVENMQLIEIFAVVNGMTTSLAKSLVEESATQGLGAVRRRLRNLVGAPAPSDVVRAYRRLQDAVTRCQMRLHVLQTVHSAQWNPLQVVGQVAGFPLLVGVLERLGQDFASLTAAWRDVNQLGSPQSKRAAEELIAALLSTTTLMDPGWVRPGRRRNYRQRSVELGLALGAQQEQFKDMIDSEAGSSRRARRVARDRLNGLRRVHAERS